MIRHLPAIIWRDDTEQFWTMAAACGKRGPLATRDTAEGGQAMLLNLDTLCADCMVTWDAAEEAGRVRPVFYRSQTVTWAGAGAVLWATEPEPWKCPHCSKPTGGHGFHRMPISCFAVVVRDQRSGVKRAG